MSTITIGGVTYLRSEKLILSGTLALRPLATLVPTGTEYHDTTSAGYVYESDGISWVQTSTNGAVHVRPVPADFTLSTYPLSATAASQRIAIADAVIARIAAANRATSATFIRIKFGDLTVAADATNDMLVNTFTAPENIAVPAGATHMAFIRELAESADINFTLALGE